MNISSGKEVIFLKINQMPNSNKLRPLVFGELCNSSLHLFMFSKIKPTNNTFQELMLLCLLEHPVHLLRAVIVALHKHTGPHTTQGQGGPCLLYSVRPINLCLLL